jgi:methionyl-tRNA formyltransferase
LAAADGRLTVACGAGALDLLQLQRPGGRRIDTAALLQARPGMAGRMLGG